MYWSQFPSELHPETLDVAMAVIFQRGEVGIDKAVLVGANAVALGYAKARGEMVRGHQSGRLDEDTVRNTIAAAMEPDNGKRGAISWAVLIQIGLAILEALKNRT